MSGFGSLQFVANLHTIESDKDDAAMYFYCIWQLTYKDDAAMHFVYWL
jgi:hypothetical protein